MKGAPNSLPSLFLCPLSLSCAPLIRTMTSRPESERERETRGTIGRERSFVGETRQIDIRRLRCICIYGYCAVKKNVYLCKFECTIFEWHLNFLKSE